jgi:DNA-binding CsgD family transcriptional regulator
MPQHFRVFRRKTRSGTRRWREPDTVLRERHREPGERGSGMLEMLDLSPEENACYEELVANPRVTHDELRRRVAIDERRLQQAVDGLEDKGLVSASLEDPPRLVPAPPEVAVEVLILQQRERFERARIYAAELMDRYREGDGPGDVGDYVEVVRGSDAVQQRCEQVQRLARDELRLVLRCDDPEFATATGGEPVLWAEGIEIRRICERQALEGDGGGSFPPLRAENEDVRILPELPLSFVVADRALGLLPWDGDDGTAAFVVHPSRLLDVMLHLADTLWVSATPVARSRAQGASDEGVAGITGRDLQILQLLHAGLTDFAIARRLDVSERTVGRRVSGLMRAAGAQTRFQLGWRAAERGWLAGAEAPDTDGSAGTDDLPTLVTTLPEPALRPSRSAAADASAGGR